MQIFKNIKLIIKKKKKKIHKNWEKYTPLHVLPP